MDALGRLPIVLTERGESYRLELDRLLAERDVTIEPLVEAGNTETLVHLAERGVGATFVPRFSAANELASGALVELGSDMPAVRMETQMLWLCLVKPRFRKRALLSFGFRHESFSGSGAGTPLYS